jgi:hypothetical protein
MNRATVPQTPENRSDLFCDCRVEDTVANVKAFGCGDLEDDPICRQRLTFGQSKLRQRQIARRRRLTRPFPTR